MLLEFLPLVAFGGTYYFYDLYVATATLMVAMAVVLAVRVLVQGKRDRMFLISCVLVWIFGGLTLVLQDKSFLQWKPTVFGWIIAATLLGSELLSKSNLLEIIVTKANPKFKLPKNVWRNLCLGWSLGFIAKGGLNLYFAYYQSESTWVLFKLAGQPVLTIVFIALTIFYLRNDIMSDANKDEALDSPS